MSEPYNVVTVPVTTHNISELLWVLRTGETAGDDQVAPEEAMGAWLYRHADAAEVDRKRLLDLMGLKLVPSALGGTKVVKKEPAGKGTP